MAQLTHDPRVTAFGHLVVMYEPPDQLQARTRETLDTTNLAKCDRLLEHQDLWLSGPVLVNSSLKVLAGHCRVLAALQAKLPEIPTIRLEHLTEAQAKAFALAENRLAEISTWNEVMLAETLRELSVEDLDFDLGVIGFSTTDIDLRIETLEAAERRGPTRPTRFHRQVRL